MQRASCTSVGLRSTWPPAQNTIGHSPAVTFSGSSRALASGSSSESSASIGWLLRVRNSARRRTPDDRPARRSPGRRRPTSSRATRRRIRARMTVSPRSASVTSTARSPCGLITSASTVSSASASTSAGRPLSWASSPMNEPGVCVLIGSWRSGPSRRVTATWPLRITVSPWPRSPTRSNISPVAKVWTWPKWRSRPTSAGREDREHLVAASLQNGRRHG